MNPRTRFTLIFHLVLSVCAVCDVNANATDAPDVRVTNVRRVFHNGEHNAFTDMVRFSNRFYLAFPSCPDGHGVHPASSIIILESEDGRTWKPVHRSGSSTSMTLPI